MAATKSSAKSGKKTALKAIAADSTASIQFQLRIIAVELRCALSTISVASHALCEQSADIDADVAVVLQRGAGAPVHAALERVEAMLRQAPNGGRIDTNSQQSCH